MKKKIAFFAVLLALSLIFNFTVYATPISKDTSEFYYTAVNFISQNPLANIDIETIEVVSITELNSLEDGNFYAYVFDFCDDNDLRAYAIINARTNTLIQYAESASPYLEGKKSRSNQEFYYAPFSYWASNGNGRLTNIIDGTTALATDVIGNSNKDSISERSVERYINGAFQQNVDEDAERENSAARDLWSKYNYILNVPDYQQEGGHLCMNTSVLNIIAYHDANGLPYLITGTIAQARDDIEAAFVAAGGIGVNANIPTAIANYVSNHGGSYNYYTTVTNYTSPEFYDLTFEIDYGDPCLVGFPTYYNAPHMTTGVGYQVFGGEYYAIVHDNHSTTSVDVTILFSEVDFVASVGIFNN